MRFAASWLATIAALTLAGTAIGLGAAVAHAAEVTPPRIDRSAGKIRIIYPPGAQAQGEEGVVDLSLQLDRRGEPTGRYRIAKSSGYDDLDMAALQSAMDWRYKPGTGADGDAEAGWVAVHIEYKLPKTGSAPPAKAD